MKIGDEVFYTVAEAAEQLGLSPRTIRAQIHNGALDAVMVGRSLIIPERKIKEYDERRKGPRGFAREDHPLYGKRGGGGRPKSDAN